MEIAARMGLTALVIGTVAAVIGTGRVTWSLVASTTLCWSFIPILQLLTGLLLVRGAVARSDALARYFAIDRYWSSWLLALAAMLLLAPDPGRLVYLGLTAVIPLICTARALVVFRRDLFGESRAAARRVVAAHQTITILLILAYSMWAGALWPRLVQMLGA